MKVALLAPLWKTVPPRKYGGSELVVANLAKGLVDLGHEVTTFACGGSKPAGALVAVMPKPMYELASGFSWRGVEAYEFLSFFELGKRMRKFDIVHNHMGLHPVALAPLLSAPLVTTLHSSVPPDFPYLADAFKAYPFVSISDAQRSLAPSLNYVATVHHGIDTRALKPRLSGKGSGFLFMGTLSANKGVDLAVRAARELGVPLTIAGDVRDGDRPFLDAEVFPYVGARIRFVGEVGHEEKARLMREADALLFPARWHEAFGLVMIEALACGTPVAALPAGAVPEVLRDGQTGAIAPDETSFVEAARRAVDLSREACRREAEERFDLSVMARRYAEAYAALRKESRPLLRMRR